MKVKYCRITLNKKGKKKVHFGDTWGAMKKKHANASFIQTGDGMYVIDIDTKKIPKKYKKWVASLKGFPTVETARGYHIYVISNVPMTNHQDIFKDEKFKVDIRGEGGLIFTDYWGKEDGISYIKTGKPIKDKKFKIFKSLPKHVREPKQRKVSNEERGDVGLSKKHDVKRMMAKIDVMKFQDRDSWMGIIASIYHALGAKGEKIARKWSQGDKSSYDEYSFDSIWRQCTEGKYGDSWSVGTLKLHANEVKVEDVFKDVSDQVEKIKLAKPDTYIKTGMYHNKIADFPKELKYTNKVVKYLDRYKVITNNGISKLGAINIASLCSMGRAYTETKAPTSMFITGIAPTGAGKDAVIKSAQHIKKLLHTKNDEVQTRIANGTGVQSPQALDTIIRKTETKALQLIYDEFGSTLSEMLDKKGSTAKKMLAVQLREMYSVNKGDTYAGANYSDRGGKDTEVAAVSVDNLSFGILGMTTLGQLTRGLHNEALANGTLNRFIWVDASGHKNTHNNNDIEIGEMPYLLRKHIRKFRNKPTATIVHLSKGAKEFYHTTMIDFNMQRGELYGWCNGDDNKHALFSRVSENALRLATALAFFEEFKKVPLWLIEWAHEFVVSNTKHFYSLFEDRADDEDAVAENSILDRTVEWMKGRDGWIGKSDLGRGGSPLRKLVAFKRQRLITILLDEGRIKEKKSSRRMLYKGT